MIGRKPPHIFTGRPEALPRNGSVAIAFFLLLWCLLVCLAFAAGGCAVLGLPKNPTPLQRVEAIEQDYLDVFGALSLLRAAGYVSDADWKHVEDIDRGVRAGIASYRADIETGGKPNVNSLRKAVRAAVFELLPYLRAAESEREAQPTGQASGT